MTHPSRFLVTAGGTLEAIDRVRTWGNVFTGNTGYAIARALAPLGSVDLLTSNRAHADEANRSGAIKASVFTSHAQLKAALHQRMQTPDAYAAVFMTAAVSDYKPVGSYEVIDRKPDGNGGEVWHVRDVQADKVRSIYEHLAVLAERTEKLVDLFRANWNYRGLLVKFKLEVGVSKDELIRIGRESRQSSRADYLVANTLDMVAGPDAGAYLLSDKDVEFVPRRDLPSRLTRLVEERLKG